MARRHGITSVITGDIINSRKIKDNKKWLAVLKKNLSLEGSSPKSWEIYRGDSFQVEVINPAKALSAAIRIKANMKCIQGVDARMAIGIGKKGFTAPKITESNGEAFINSGEKLEILKKEKQTLAIKTPWEGFDKEMNVYIRLALLAMDNWTGNSAELIKLLIQKPDITQTEIAKILKISQSSVSERLKRASYAEIIAFESLYEQKIKKMIS